MLNVKFLSDNSLYHGKTGATLFLLASAEYFPSLKLDKFSKETLQQISQGLSALINSGKQTDLPLDFAGGLSGIAWAIQHVAAHGFLDIDADKTLREFDDLILSGFYLGNGISDMSLKSGCAGIGKYFLVRYINTQDSQLKKQYLNAIIKLVEDMHYWLERNNAHEPSKFSLKATTNKLDVIAFLCSLKNNFFSSNKFNELIEACLDNCRPFILSLDSKCLQGNSTYLMVLDNISKTLACDWQAGELPMELTNDPADVALTHSLSHALHGGTSEIAEYYQAVYRRYGDKRFNDRYQECIFDMLRDIDEDNGLGGFKTLPATGIASLGLYSGACGIGFSLLNFVEPGSDRSWHSALHA